MVDGARHWTWLMCGLDLFPAVADRHTVRVRGTSRGLSLPCVNAEHDLIRQSACQAAAARDSWRAPCLTCPFDADLQVSVARTDV